MRFNWFSTALILMFVMMLTTNVFYVKVLAVGVIALYLGHVARKVWLEFNEE